MRRGLCARTFMRLDFYAPRLLCTRGKKNFFSNNFSKIFFKKNFFSKTKFCFPKKVLFFFKCFFPKKVFFQEKDFFSQKQVFFSKKAFFSTKNVILPQIFFPQNLRPLARDRMRLD